MRDVKMPHRANEGDAGLDFYFPRNLTVQDLQNVESNAHLEFVLNNPKENQFCVSTSKDGKIVDIFIGPKTRITIPSGIRALLEPRASMMQVNNKSGRSTKQGFTFTAQVCDSPYTGEYHLGVHNNSHVPQKLEVDKAVVQMIHIPIYLTEPEEINKEEFDKDSKNWGTRQDNGMGNASKNN
ncbi:MAG: hypothetical protein NC131_06395 [Roseburia sp.]|nr:hypothetical protein [Roseburia sp.]